MVSDNIFATGVLDRSVKEENHVRHSDATFGKADPIG